MNRVGRRALFAPGERPFGLIPSVRVVRRAMRALCVRVGQRQSSIASRHRGVLKQIESERPADSRPRRTQSGSGHISAAVRDRRA